MNYLNSINEVNGTLDLYRGSKAKIWLFLVSRKRMYLRLFLPNSKDVLYIVAAGCENIKGPFSWDFADLHIVQYHDSDELFSSIKDRNSGFELIASGGIVGALCSDEEFDKLIAKENKIE